MNDIDDILIEQTVPHYTELRPVLVGSFNISKAAIPFFQTTMSLEDVASGLQLVENLPSDLRQQWRLEELFQREIDWTRVEDEIVNNYLRLPEKLHFFNALTVALLPLNQNSHLATQYGDVLNPPPPRDSHNRAPWSVRNIGGVQLITAEGTTHGFIRWDPKRIFAATIDGQHRLAALKLFHSRGNLTQQNLKTTVSVILLILDPRAGLELGAHSLSQDENPILTVVREIFIDLNHNSKGVVRARKILLDDQEIESRCVRRLMAERVGERPDGVLPLGLVHWQHKVTAKFNAGDATGPFITTVELLYAIVKDILDVKAPDPLDEKEVRAFIARVEGALGVSQIIEANPARYPGQPALITYVERNYLKEGFEKPFSNLPHQYLRAADEGFIRTWRTPIVRVLTEFEPYRAFIEQVDARGGITGDLAFYLCLPEKAQGQQVKEWGEKRYDKLDKPLRELTKMKSDDWPFYAVFQKGMMRATARGLRNYPALTGRASATQEEFLDTWLTFLNDLYARGLFAVKCPMPKADGGDSVGCGGTLWSGIALNPGAKTVKWNDVTVSRIAALLELWWFFYAQGRASVTHLVSAIEHRDGGDKFPGGKNALKALRDGVRGSTTGSDENVDEAEITKRIKARVELIIDAGKNVRSMVEASPTPASPRNRREPAPPVPSKTE